ncbi:MAG: hypothetical protein UZ22_OP11002000771 [Microgenomates bacterium OLB23]|nr:MAG: hypothetical protein UZ22_OP11002000771 [Microgenomates bacterium OLB23]
MVHIFASIMASCILVVRNSIRILHDPYKAMREVSREHDVLQIAIILLVSCGYFLYAAQVRNAGVDALIVASSAMNASLAFVTTFCLSIGFLYMFGKIFRGRQNDMLLRIINLTAYSLLPAFMWFTITSTLFVVLPPPRYATPQGIVFSIVFVVYSLVLLELRFMMLYMTIRFALRTSFLDTVKVMAAYLAVFLPYAFVLYKLGFSRIPYM